MPITGSIFLIIGGPLTPTPRGAGGNTTTTDPLRPLASRLTVWGLRRGAHPSLSCIQFRDDLDRAVASAALSLFLSPRHSHKNPPHLLPLQWRGIELWSSTSWSSFSHRGDEP